MARVAVPIKNVPFFLRRITPKFVVEAMNRAEPESKHMDLLNLPRPVKEQLLYELYGTIRVATIVPDKTGQRNDSVRFSGALKAYTPPDEKGEQYIFESGKAYIPVLEEYLYSALKSAQEVEPGAYLEIALAIGMKPAEAGKPSMTGYEWDVQKLIATQPTKDDPIERLRQEAKAQQLRLAGPTASAAPQTEPSPAPNGRATSNGSVPEVPSASTESSSAPEPNPKHSRRGHASA